MGDHATDQSTAIDALFIEANKSHESGRYKRAFRIFLHLATRYEHTAAMGNLARMYELGEGTQRDLDASLMWDRKAAALGCAIARHNLAIYHRGRGDTVAARDIFQTLLDEGNDDAALELARMYAVSPLETKRVIRYLERALRSKDGLTPHEREEAETLLAGLRPSAGRGISKKPAAKKSAATK